MTRLLISTAIAGLLALGGTALAQPGDHDRGHGPDNHGQPGPAAHAAPQANHGPDNRGHEDHRASAGHQAAPAAAPASPAAMRDQSRSNAMRGPSRGRDSDRHGAVPVRGPEPHNSMRGPTPGTRIGHPNFSEYHRNYVAPRHYHARSSYHRPRGWYARRWTFGEILPTLFWAPDYWLNDYYDYGLMPPPPGTVWVRDGDDALLIDRDSGEIIRVEYSVFY